MKKIRNLLMAEMLSCIIASLAIVILYETETLLPGSLAGNANAEFLTVSLMEILTICMVPLALRLFKFGNIGRSLASDGGRRLAKWGSIRMMMICMPMMVNTLFYYLFGFNVAFGYMGIICLICLVFINPTMSRCVSETGSEE